MRTENSRTNLAAMTPRSSLASTGYCLADPDREYLVYLPAGQSVSVDLTATLAGCWSPGFSLSSQPKGCTPAEEFAYQARWFQPATGKWKAISNVAGGAHREFTAPFPAPAVLRLIRE